ncbi:hypothetical protein BC828DRAFT_375892 [Blastocladiella britannica]|nr:hypothetical protein BC828DRAFT_375892 [Blastocladiella britannica]
MSNMATSARYGGRTAEEDPEQYGTENLEGGDQYDEEDDDDDDDGNGQNDDDDDGEDDDDEEERPSKRRRTEKPRRSAASNFLDIEAAVDDDEDAEYGDDDYDGADDFVEKDEEAEAADVSDFLSARQRREVDKSFAARDDADLEAIAQRFNEKHQRLAPRRYVGGDVHSTPQQLLLPSVRDPKLWMVKCREGKERDIVHLMMRKALDNKRRVVAGIAAPIPIMSVLYRDDVKGYIYIEANLARDVASAIEGVPGVYTTKMVLVPVGEMPDVLRIRGQKQTDDLATKTWVRIKRGKYAGDLARITETTADGSEATVQILPRLNLDDFDDQKRAMARAAAKAAAKDTGLDDHDDDGGAGAMGAKRKRAGNGAAPGAGAATAAGSGTVRPPQKLFNPREYPTNVQKKITTVPGGFNRLGGELFRNGYLVKSVRVQALELNGAPPTLEEIERFTGSSGSIDSEMLLSLKTAAQEIEQQRTVFHAGDRVVVTEGDLANIPSMITSIANGIATIVPQNKTLFTRSTVPVAQLRKHFSIGDSVRVVQGRNDGLIGTVVAVNGTTITVVEPVRHIEVQVFARDLADAKDVTIQTSSGRNGGSNYDTSRSGNSNGGSNLPPSLLGAGGASSGPPSGGPDSFRAPPPPPRARPVGGDSRPRGNQTLGLKVKILRGQYKGFVGRVMSIVNEATYKVRMEANMRTIPIPRADLAADDGSGMFRPLEYMPPTPIGGSGLGSARPTPLYDGGMGSATGSATPAHRGSGSGAWGAGGTTPAHRAGGMAGGRTPAVGYGGSQTPNPHGSGSMTPYHSGAGDFDGGRTPAWDIGSRTPYHGAGGATPGAGGSSAWDVHSSSSSAVPAGGRDSNTSSSTSSSTWAMGGRGSGVGGGSDWGGGASARSGLGGGSAYDTRVSGTATGTGGAGGSSAYGGVSSYSQAGGATGGGGSYYASSYSAYGGGGGTSAYGATPAGVSSSNVGGSAGALMSGDGSSVGPSASGSVAAGVDDPESDLASGRWLHVSLLVEADPAATQYQHAYLAPGQSAPIIRVDEALRVCDLDAPNCFQVPAAAIRPVAPAKNDKVMIIAGKKRTQEGTVVGMNGGNAVIRIGTLFESFPLKYLCTMRTAE